MNTSNSSRLQRSASLLLLLVFAASLLAGCTGTQPSQTQVVQSTAAQTQAVVTQVPVTLQPTAVPTVAPTATQVASAPWWQSAVFYEIFVRSFYDSNGDGKGDFQGIIDKLDYLNDGDPNTSSDLGITAIWLMPIHPSPSYHGYDVTDYRDVNPDYGTMDDFKRLLAEAHKRGIHVIMDFVINHTSSQHPWFIQAQDPKSPYHDWYIWSDTDPGYLGPSSQKVWYKAANGQYYYAVFWDQMPDLNLDNPDVTKEIYDIARFWLQDVGVDGFRLDAAKQYIEEGKKQENTDKTHAWLKQFQSYVKSVNPDAMTVGEVWSDTFSSLRYVKNSELDMVFDFDLASSMVSGVNNRDAKGVGNTMFFNNQKYPLDTKGNFLTNHDQNRVMSVLGDDLSKAKLAASVLFAPSGVPFIYYGEEIGMLGNKPDENIRRPMQWSTDANGGFSTGTPWESVLPTYQEKNVAAELQNPDSLLAHYQKLIQLHNSHTALNIGKTIAVDSGSSSVLAVFRTSGDENILILINLSDQPVSDYQLALDEGPLNGTYQPDALMGEGQFAPLTANGSGGFENYQPIPEIPGQSTLILKLNQ